MSKYDGARKCYTLIPNYFQKKFAARFADYYQSCANQNPVADAGQDVVEECVGNQTPVQLDGSLTFDPDGDSIEFNWSTAAGAGEPVLIKRSFDGNGNHRNGQIRDRVSQNLIQTFFDHGLAVP